MLAATCRRRSEIKCFLLPRIEPLTGGDEQQRQIGVDLRGTDVLDVDDLTVVVRHDLDRART